MPGWKRLVDVAWCLAALPVLALFTLMVTIVMKIVSPGPVFFRNACYRKPLSSLTEIAGMCAVQADHPGGWIFGRKLLADGDQIARIGADSVEQKNQLRSRAGRLLDNDG